MNKNYNIPRNIGIVRYITYISSKETLSSKSYFVMINTEKDLIPGNVYNISRGPHVAFIDYLKTPEDYKELKKFIGDQQGSINDIEKYITSKIEDDKPLDISKELQQLINKVVILI